MEKTIAISADDHRQVALFFDEIIPLHSSDSVPVDVHRFRSMDDDKYVMYEPHYLETGNISEVFVGLLDNVIHSSIDNKDTLHDFMMFEFSNLYAQRKTFINPTCVLYYCENFESDKVIECFQCVRDMIAAKMAELTTGTTPIFSSATNRNRHYLENNEIYPSVEVILSDIKLVDTKESEWRQIIEFKRDEENLCKLRNLRLFFFDNYKDKEAEYIKDSIDKKVEEYYDAVRKHGFELKASTITSLLNSKSTLGLMGLMAASIMSGNTNLLLGSTLGTAIIETSKIVLNIAKRRFDFKTYKNSHDLAYIFAAKEKLGASTNCCNKRKIGAKSKGTFS